MSFRGLSATVSGGVSAAERAPPGWFALCTAAAGSGDSGIDLLAAGASRGYLGLGEGSAGGGLRAGVRLRLAGQLGRIDARYVMSVGLPGFVPGPFLPSEEKLAFALERRWPARDGAWEAALDLSNRIEIGQDGEIGRRSVREPVGRLGFDAPSGRRDGRCRPRRRRRGGDLGGRDGFRRKGRGRRGGAVRAVGM